MTPKSASKKATGLELIEVPRSACRVSWPGRMAVVGGKAAMPSARDVVAALDRVNP